MKGSINYNRSNIKNIIDKLFKVSNNLIFVHDLNGKFLDANDKALKTFGFQREEIKNIKFRNLLDEEQLNKALSILKKIIKDGYQSELSIYQLRNKKGEIIYIETDSFLLKENNVPYALLGFGRDITDETYYKESLERRSQLEFLIAEIMHLFICATDLDVAIRSSLRNIGIFSGANRAYQFRINSKTQTMSNTHEWCNKGILPQIDNLQNIPLDDYPWWIKKLYSRENIIIKDISIIPKEASTERMFFEKRSLKNMIITPIYLKNELFGFIGYENIRSIGNWEDEDYYLMQMVSDIIGNSLNRNNLNFKLTNSEIKFRSFFNYSSEGIFIHDLNGRFLEVNETACKQLEYSKDEFLNLQVKDIVHPKERKALPTNFSHLIYIDQELVETIHISKSGIEVPTELFVKPINYEGNMAIIGFARDITKRKLATSKLKESEMKSGLILENINDLVLILNQNYEFEFINESTFHKLLGYTKNDLINKSFTNLLYPDDLKKGMNVLDKVFKEGEGKIELRYKKKVKGYIWIESRGKIFLDKNKRKRAIIISRDISERKENEINRQKYLDQIIKSSQFKTDFMAMMSHELRTPLNAIIGFTDLLIEGLYGTLNDEQKEFTDVIKNSADHLLTLITSIIDISRIESGNLNMNFSENYLNILLKDVTTSLKPLWEKKNLKFKILGLKPDKTIYVDSLRFKEIIYNILGNAIKYTQTGEIKIELIDEPDYWRFKITDTGIGIEEKDHDKVFKEFQRIKQSKGKEIIGSGLGLPLTRRLIILHGGSISFTSTIGKGSVFTFTISKNFNNLNKSEDIV